MRQARRQQRRAPAAVAPAGAEPDVVALEHGDAQRRVGARRASSAVHSPVKPAPTIATSTSRSPSSGEPTATPVGRHRRRPQRRSPAAIVRTRRIRLQRVVGRAATDWSADTGRGAAGPCAPPTLPPAGWYPDPSGQPMPRYFDGRVWTWHTAARPGPGDARAPDAADRRPRVGAVAVLARLADRQPAAHVEHPRPLRLADRRLRRDPASSSATGRRCGGAGTPPGAGAPAIAGATSGCGCAGPTSGGGRSSGWRRSAGEIAVGDRRRRSCGSRCPATPRASATLDLDRTYVIALLVTAVVAAPIVEEMVFRGLILRGLLSRMRWVLAVIAAGRAVRPRPRRPGRAAPATSGWRSSSAAVGVVFGGAAYLLRRIGPTIIAHAIFNGVVLLDRARPSICHARAARRAASWPPSDQSGARRSRVGDRSRRRSSPVQRQRRCPHGRCPSWR